MGIFLIGPDKPKIAHKIMNVFSYPSVLTFFLMLKRTISFCCKSQSTHLDPVPLTYISHSIDFVRILRRVKYLSVFLCSYGS